MRPASPILVYGEKENGNSGKGGGRAGLRRLPARLCLSGERGARRGAVRSGAGGSRAAPGTRGGSFGEGVPAVPLPGAASQCPLERAVREGHGLPLLRVRLNAPLNGRSRRCTASPALLHPAAGHRGAREALVGSCRRGAARVFPGESG